MDVQFQLTSTPILYLFLTAAVISDFRLMKISNRLIFLGLFVSMVLRLYYCGWISIFRQLPILLSPVILLFFFYLAGILGAGDIKLFSLIGGYVNFRSLWKVMLCSFVVAAVASLIRLMLTGRLLSGLKDGFSYLLQLAQGSCRPYSGGGNESRIHFAAAILAGFVIAGPISGC